MENRENKKRILLMSPMLHQGGFERVCVKTARLLLPHHNVSILIFSDADIAFDISGLDIININIGSTDSRFGKLCNVYKRVRAVKRIKKQQQIDITYSFGLTANLVNVLSKAGDRVWVGIRGFLDVESRLYPIICKKADKIVCAAKAIEEHIKREYPEKSVVTIYNSFEFERIEKQGMEPILPEEEAYFKDKQVLVAVGREDDVKGFWHLIRIFAFLQGEIESLRLVIVGEGTFEGDKKFAESLGVADYVLFTGVRRNPFSYVKKADLYVMTSLSEGFPNSLVEAMALSVPVISTNCPSGPAEILSEDYRVVEDTAKVYEAEYGILVPNLSGEKQLSTDKLEKEEMILLKEIKRVIEDKSLQEKMQTAGKKRAGSFTEQKYTQELLENIERES